MRKFIIVYASVLICPAPAWAGSVSPEEFHRKVYVLHQQQIAQREIRTQEKTDNYSGAAAAGYGFVDTRYYDASSGRLLSYVRRDAAKPENLHIVEVNVYQNGRLVRDFGSMTLPWAPLRPVRTFINLHHYNGGLHSFRQYDLHGEVGYEFCEGAFAGNPVRISLDYSDITETIKATADYKACFDGMESSWARYLTPH